MKFVAHQGGWLLIDEEAPHDAAVIATLRNDVEVLALKHVCERHLNGELRNGEFFDVASGHVSYRITPLKTLSGKLDFEVRGSDGSSFHVETQFSLP